jgi:hypothetical protein
VSAKLEVGQAVSVIDRDRTYAGEIVRARRIVVDVRYLGRVVKFWRNTQRALGTETGPPIYFRTPDDIDGQGRTQAARHLLASHGVQLSPRRTFTVEQVEALAEVVKTWQE